MVKHTQTIRWQEPKNCLSMFDHFMGLAPKGLTLIFLATLTISDPQLLQNIFKKLELLSLNIFGLENGKLFPQ